MQLKTYDFDHFQIHIADENELDHATLAALYSRSTKSVSEITYDLEKTRKRVIETYLIGYGHESIGQMIDVKLYLEGIPMYVAYLIEDHSLFRGQESSTRYIDFSKQKMGMGLDPLWYQDRIDDYHKAFQIVEPTIKTMIPLGLTEAERATHERACSARAFDICRGLLPFGATTNVAWFGNINTLRQHLFYLDGKYPQFSYYFHAILVSLDEHFPETTGYKTSYDYRPNLYPRHFRNQVEMKGILDIGSLRDLNRHRVGWKTIDVIHSVMPVLHPWYFKLLKYFDALPQYVSQTQHAYLATPMGERAFIDVQQALLGHTTRYVYRMPREQASYFGPLRSGLAVHPTLRQDVLACDSLAKYIPERNKVEDLMSTGYYTRRGNDFIQQKG